MARRRSGHVERSAGFDHVSYTARWTLGEAYVRRGCRCPRAHVRPRLREGSARARHRESAGPKDREVVPGRLLGVINPEQSHFSRRQVCANSEVGDGG